MTNLPTERDVAAIAALNNLFARPRGPAFVSRLRGAWARPSRWLVGGFSVGARRRRYDYLFAVSFSERKILLGRAASPRSNSTVPRKILRYTRIDRTEIEVGEKTCCFVRDLRERTRRVS